MRKIRRANLVNESEMINMLSHSLGVLCQYIGQEDDLSNGDSRQLTLLTIHRHLSLV